MSFLFFWCIIYLLKWGCCILLIEALRGQVGPTEFIAYAISALIVVFLALPVHEFAHGFIANKLGDPTARLTGRLTLNPFAHIDYFGAAAILIFGFGWAKPVGVNPRYFKNSKVGMALTALAGPVSNIIMAFISLLLLNVFTLVFSFSSNTVTLFIILFFFQFASINISLAVFNLLPVPPLDGSRILGVVLPTRIYFKVMQYERYISLALIFLLYIGVLSVPLSYLSGHLFAGVSWLADLPFSLIF